MAGEFIVHTPAGPVRLSDLPLSDLSDIERESEVQWARLLIAPAATALAALAVYRGCCKHVGAEPEELTARRILDGGVFELVDDDLPTMFEDAAPKAGGETPTPGSSGAPDDSDGPPT